MGEFFNSAQHYAELLGHREEIIKVLGDINHGKSACNTLSDVDLDDYLKKFSGTGKILRDLILSNEEGQIRDLLDAEPNLQEYMTSRSTWDWRSFSMWYTNWSPLHLATTLGHRSIIQMLIGQYCLQVDARHVYGKRSGTPLHLAIDQNNVELVLSLIHI